MITIFQIKVTLVRRISKKPRAKEVWQIFLASIESFNQTVFPSETLNLIESTPIKSSLSSERKRLEYRNEYREASTASISSPQPINKTFPFISWASAVIPLRIHGCILSSPSSPFRRISFHFLRPHHGQFPHHSPA
jgi:hypothetical protein